MDLAVGCTYWRLVLGQETHSKGRPVPPPLHAHTHQITYRQPNSLTHFSQVTGFGLLHFY